MSTAELTDDVLQSEYQRLTKAGWDRSLDIAKRRRERHEKIDFDNPLFVQQLKDLEQELKKRGLK